MQRRCVPTAGLAVTLVLFVGLLAQFLYHMLLVEDPELTTTGDVLDYLIFSAGLTASALLGLHWTGQRRWVAATIFAIAAIFATWWVMAMLDSLAVSRPVWITAVRLTGLFTVVLITLFAAQKLSRASPSR